MSEFDQDAKYKRGLVRGKVAVEIGDDSPFLQATQKLFERITANPKEAKLFMEDQESYIRKLGFRDEVSSIMIQDSGLLEVIRLISDERLHELIKGGDIQNPKNREEFRSFYMESLPQVPSEVLEKIKAEILSKPEVVKAIKKLMTKEKLRSSDVASIAIDEKDEFSIVAVAVAVVIYGVVFMGAVAINWAGAVNVAAVGNIGITVNAVYTTNATITSGEDGPKASTTLNGGQAFSEAWALAGGRVDSLETIAKIQREADITHLVDQLSVAYPGSVTPDNRDSVTTILSCYVAR